MAKKQSGLGKGLNALMLENSVDSMVATNTLSINERLVPKIKSSDDTLTISQSERTNYKGNTTSEITVTIPEGAALNKLSFDTGVGRHYAYIYKYDHGWLCISGTQSKAVTNFLVLGTEQFFKDWSKYIFYDQIDYDTPQLTL